VIDVEARGIGQALRVGAGDLHADRGRFAVMIHALTGFGGAPQAWVGGGHFRDCNPGAHALAQQPERLVGDTGHRCQQHGRVNQVGADAHEGIVL
jgi:hypothetical protein